MRMLSTFDRMTIDFCENEEHLAKDGLRLDGDGLYQIRSAITFNLSQSIQDSCFRGIGLLNDDLSARFGVTYITDGDSVLFMPQGLAYGQSWISLTFSKAAYSADLQISPVGRPVY